VLQHALPPLLLVVVLLHLGGDGGGSVSAEKHGMEALIQHLARGDDEPQNAQLVFRSRRSAAVAADEQPAEAAVETEAGAAVPIRAKRASGQFSTQQIIEVLLCIFLPPVAVLVHGGHEMVIHLIINIVLWVLGWIPGTIHAFWYCFYRGG